MAIAESRASSFHPGTKTRGQPITQVSSPVIRSPYLEPRDYPRHTVTREPPPSRNREQREIWKRDRIDHVELAGGIAQQRHEQAGSEDQWLQAAPSSRRIVELTRAAHAVKPDTVTFDRAVAVPELHPEAMHIVSAAAQRDGKLPQVLLSASFHPRINSVVDEAYLHRDARVALPCM